MEDASPEFSRRLSAASRAVSRLLRKAERRLAAIEGDLRAIDEAEAWAERAPWLISEAARAPRGATALRVPDWSTGEEVVLEFPLDPAVSARQQVESIFAEARRLRRGREQVEARLADATARLGQLESMAREAAALALLIESDLLPREAREQTDEGLEHRLASLESAAAKLLPKGHALSGPKQPHLARIPYREFIVDGELRVLVGKTAKDNDELTLHIARPHHVWLHAKGYPGSHVVACVAKGHSLTSEQLIDCAHLAAHFSDAEGEPLVEVSYLPRRYLRKPRKSPPGMVVLDREKVLTLRVDPARLKRLLGGNPSS